MTKLKKARYVYMGTIAKVKAINMNIKKLPQVIDYQPCSCLTDPNINTLHNRNATVTYMPSTQSEEYILENIKSVK